MNNQHGPYQLFMTNSANTDSAFVKKFLSKIVKDYDKKDHWKLLHQNNIPIFIALEYQYKKYKKMVRELMGIDH